jgi:hypothetical protein
MDYETDYGIEDGEVQQDVRSAEEVKVEVTD